MLESKLPEKAWPLMVKLIEAAPSEEALAFVAAGPLEVLIRTGGDNFEDRIVQCALSDARFRRALEGVWGWEDVLDTVAQEPHQTVNEIVLRA